MQKRKLCWLRWTCKFVIHMEHGKIQESYSLCEPEGRERLLRFFLNEMG